MVARLTMEFVTMGLICMNNEEKRSGIMEAEKCSFCGTSKDNVYIIAGPGVGVCENCIGLMNNVLEERPVPNRRSRQDLYTAEEQMISLAIHSIEELGADVILTDCVVLLSDAMTKLQDWLEQEGILK